MTTFNETYAESKARISAEFDAEEAREAAERAAYRAKRDTFLQDLLGGPDMHSWLVPQTVPEIDAVLAEHLAQLRNAVRYTMQAAIDDNEAVERRNVAATAITRMIQVNLGIAKVLRAQPAPDSKTVHGGDAVKDAQD